MSIPQDVSYPKSEKYSRNNVTQTMFFIQIRKLFLYNISLSFLAEPICRLQMTIILHLWRKLEYKLHECAFRRVEFVNVSDPNVVCSAIYWFSQKDVTLCFIKMLVGCVRSVIPVPCPMYESILRLLYKMGLQYCVYSPL